MALPPIPARPAPPLPPLSGARATAQRAFFEAALGLAPAQQAVTSAPATAGPAIATNPSAVAAPVDAPPLAANAPQGSLLNIVV